MDACIAHNTLPLRVHCESYRPRSLEGRIFRGTGEVERESINQCWGAGEVHAGLILNGLAADLSNDVN